MNNLDLMELPDIAKNAKGGTELMLARIYDGKIPRDLLKEFQIIPTRVRDLKEDKYRILYIHDLARDPEVEILKDEGWRKFHKLVFVSNWQMQRFLQTYDIPWSRCMVLANAINPINGSAREVNSDTINFIYHTTPHRGLNILLPVFDMLCKKYDNLHLDVYSSFKLYGWDKRDEEFQQLFDFARNHPKISYHGAVSNDEVRGALQNADVFAYPSIWFETSCIALIEAMSAGLLCVHPNLGALYETAANWTTMYQFHEDMNEHARTFYGVLDAVIPLVNDENMVARRKAMKGYIDAFYNWESRAKQWEGLLQSILATNEPRGLPGQQFIYKY